VTQKSDTPRAFADFGVSLNGDSLPAGVKVLDLV
jgi:hypothetical protein